MQKIGNVAQAQGRLDGAARAYEEGLEIDRRLLKDYGETPLAIRDLYLSLSKLAEVVLAGSAQQQALYSEALMLARRLQLVFRDDSRGAEAARWVKEMESKCVT